MFKGVVRKVSANASALGRGAQGVGMVIICLVVLFSDVMFVSMLWNAFPGGFLTVAAVGGAFATGLSVIVLVIGKTHWFRPGGQLVFSWFFTGAEVLVSIANVITAVMVAESKPLGFLSYWLLIAPATPFVALVGWIVLMYLDTGRKQLHAQMEMEDEQHEAELDYHLAEHRAQMNLKHAFLGQFESFLQEETTSPENLAILRAAAARLGKQVMSGLIGSPIAQQSSQFLAPQPAQFAPQASTPVLKGDTPEEVERRRRHLEAIRAELESGAYYTSPLAEAPSSSQNGHQQNGATK